MLDGKLSFLKIEEGKWRLTNSYVLSPPCRMKGLDTDLPEPPSREHTKSVWIFVLGGQAWPRTLPGRKDTCNDLEISLRKNKYMWEDKHTFHLTWQDTKAE